MQAETTARQHLTLGHQYFFEEPRDVAGAVREFRKVVELAPAWNEDYAWLATALQELGQTDEAIIACRRAMQLAPEDARHPISLAVILMQQQEYPAAIDLLRQGIALKPHYAAADAHLFLADALLAAGQVEAACEAWQAVLTFEPMYPSYKKPHQQARRMLKKYRSQA